MFRHSSKKVPVELRPGTERVPKVSRGVNGGEKTLEIETNTRLFEPSPLPMGILSTAFWIIHAAATVQLAREGHWGTFFVFGMPMECLLATVVLLHFFGRRIVRIAGNSGTSFVGVGPIGWRRRFAVTSKSRLRVGRLHDMGYTWHPHDNPPGILLRNGKKRLCIYRDADDSIVRQVFQILTAEFPSMAPRKRKSGRANPGGTAPKG